MVIFFVACLGAAAATYADTEVERIAKFDTFLWADIFDGDIGTVVVFGFLFETGDDGSQLILGELTVMSLEKFIDRRSFFPFGQRRHGLGKCSNTECCACTFEEIATIEEAVASCGWGGVATTVAATGFYFLFAHVGYKAKGSP